MPPSFPVQNPPVKISPEIAQTAGITSLMLFLGESLRQVFLSNFAIPAAQSTILPLAEATISALGFNAPAEIVPRLPSILGHLPVIGKILPKWLVPIGDVALVTTLVTASPFSAAGIIGVGGKLLFNYSLKTLIFGIGAPAAARLVNSKVQAAYMADHLFSTQLPANIIPATAPINPWGLPPGVLGGLQESPAWFNTLDPILRVTLQGVFYGGIALIALSAVGRNPFKAKAVIIDAPSVNDIILEQAGSRMASFDYFLSLFIKLGLPFLGVLVVLAVLFKFLDLQTTLKQQSIDNDILSLSLASSAIDNEALNVSLANSKAKVKLEQLRNSQGQFTKENIITKPKKS